MSFSLKVILILFLLTIINAQEFGTISGTIKEAGNGSGLPGVNVMVKGTYYGTASDLDGRYKINNISPGSYDVEISMIGYKIIFMDLSVKKKSTIWAPKFYHGLLVHPLNPKAWMMITLAFTAFQSQGVSTKTIPTIAITFLLIQLIFHSSWFWFGSLVRQADLSEKNSRIVKIALLISLIASIVFSYY